jgi:diguanylate cyclase (GGDEF)-like protein
MAVLPAAVPLSPDELPPLTPEALAEYRARRHAGFSAQLRLGLCLGAALFVGLVAWELLLEPAVVRHSFPLRLGIAAGLLVILPLARLPALERRPELLIQLSLVTSSAGLTVLATRLPLSGVYLVGSLMLLVVMVVALADQLAMAARAFLLLLLAHDLAAVACGLPGALLLGSNLFVGSAAAVGLLLVHVAEQRDLHAFRMEVALRTLATTDGLTGLLNRRAFTRALEGELERARRHGHPLSLLLLDVDHFKRINDAHGHPAGDAVLQHLARTCTALLRRSDVAARVGGEEFALLLPHAAAGQAAQTAERLRGALAGAGPSAPVTALPSGGAQGERPPVDFTVSIGVATWGGPGEPAEALLQRADAALYAAKRAGRDRVHAA